MDLNDIFASVYELLGYAGTFSDDLFQEELYISVGLLTIIGSLVAAIVFYFANRPKRSKWQFWLLTLLGCFIYALLVGILVPQNRFTGLGLQYDTIEYILFGLKNAIISMVIFVFWSYCLKWWNPHTKGIPKLFFGKF